MVPNDLQKKRDSTRFSLAVLAIACAVIFIGALTMLISLMWAAAILLVLCAGYYGLRAQAPDLNRLAYRLRLFIYRKL